MSRSLLRSVLELRKPITRLPPTYLLPIRARGLATTKTTTTTKGAEPITPPTATSAQKITGASPTIATSQSSPLPQKQQQPPPPPPSQLQTQTQTSTSTTSPEKVISSSVAQLFPLLRAQPNHYITVHIHGKPYLVVEGDSIRLPFLMPDVVPGDVLRLDRASTLGSRDFTLIGRPFIDDSLFECRATVIGVESEPLRVVIKTKRRQRLTRRIASKHRQTVLRISELKLLGPP